jgi:hypothetical protein
MHQKYFNSYAFKWTLDLASSPIKFGLNLLLFIGIGVTSQLSTSWQPAALIVSGGILPCLLNYCLYRLSKATLTKMEALGAIPKIPAKLHLFFILDMLLIVALITLIIIGTLSAPIFKVLAAIILPVIQMVTIRSLLYLFLN